jgi:TonB family protein
MSPANFAAWFAQVAVLVALCAGLPRLLGLRSPIAQYAFWRALLVVCLALPLVQPWRTALMDLVPAPVQGAPAAVSSAQAAPSPPAAANAIDWTQAAGTIVVAGIAARLFWLALGAVRLRSMRRRASGGPVAGADDLQAAIGTRAAIFWSDDVHHPVAFGVLRPVVLLPGALRAADAAAQRAVLAHELHHVKRADWLWVVCEEVVRSVFWFHPAVWWLVSRIQLARETVVDELSILATNARRTYLDTLLAFADDTGLVSPPAFSARRHLFYRVMLLSKEGGMSSIRVALASLALTIALAAGAWTAASAFPLHAEAQASVAAAEPQPPPRDPVVRKMPPPPPPEPATIAELHRRAVEIQDEVRNDTTLTSDDKLKLIATAIGYEDRVLAREPNFVNALVYKNILLRLQANLTADPQARQALLDEANVLRGQAIALQRAGVQPSSELSGSAPPPPPPPPPPVLRSAAFARLIEQYQPVRIGGHIKPPAKIRDVKPVYPPIAQASRIQGVVIIEVLLDVNGYVVDGQVLRSIALLDEAALDAVRQWVFAPTLLNGVATPVLMTVTVNFTLQ